MLRFCVTIGLLISSVLAYGQDKSLLKEEISNLESVKINKGDIDIESKKSGKVLVISEKSENVDFKAYSIQYNAEFIASMLTTLKDIQSISSSLNILRTYSDDNFHSSFLNCGCTTAPKKIIESYKSNWEQAYDKLSKLKLPSQAISTSQTIELQEKVDFVTTKLAEVDETKIKKMVGTTHSEIIDFIAKDNIPSNEKEIENLYEAVEQLKSSIISFLSFVNLLN